ncbi:hypothetical protein V9K67_15505 [Paraflavisolibacter sp. H34]|uniref:hypothetical protein n=1 Tax=Huijunlia imazamoxiresistens TaxID=3127457 RepID=UPI003016D069
MSKWERDEQVERIRRDYDLQNRIVRTYHRLSSRDKDHQLDNLQSRRERQVREVNERHYSSRNKSYCKDDRDDRYDRDNNSPCKKAGDRS